MIDFSMGIGFSHRASKAGLTGRFLTLIKNDTQSAFFGEYYKTDRRFTQAVGGNTNVLNGQLVALDLDSSRWDGKTFTEVLAGQPELCVAGNFSTSTGWTLTQATISTGILTVDTPTGSFAAAEQSIVTTAGKWYAAYVNCLSVNSGSPVISLHNTLQQAGTLGPFRAIGPAAGALSAFAVKRGSTAPAPTQFTADDASYKELLGVGANQTTTAARPTLQTAGKGYLQFDGLDDFLTTSAMIPGSQGTIAAAFRATKGAASEYAIAGGSTTGDKRIRIGINGSGYPEFVFNATALLPVTVDHNGVDLVLVMTWGNGRRRFYVSTQPDPLVLDAAEVANQDGTGNTYKIGSGEGGTTNFLNGRLYGSLLRNVETSDNDVRSIILPYLKGLYA